jgi:hypothetical protein
MNADKRRFVIWERYLSTQFCRSVSIRVIRAIRVPGVYSTASILPTTASISLSLSACERRNATKDKIQ